MNLTFKEQLKEWKKKHMVVKPRQKRFSEELSEHE